jgi:hypothetical protein
LISNHFGDSVGGPEKAGVGGSIPSLATKPFNNLATAKRRVKNSRANNTRTSVCLPLIFGVARSNKLPRFPRRGRWRLPECWNSTKLMPVFAWEIKAEDTCHARGHISTPPILEGEIDRVGK